MVGYKKNKLNVNQFSRKNSDIFWRKDTSWQTSTLGVSGFKIKKTFKSKDNRNKKITFSSLNLNWIFNKIVNCLMHGGKKEIVEKHFRKYITASKKKKKKRNRPKALLVFLLCLITAFRPLIKLNKTITEQEKTPSKRKLRFQKKKKIVPNLSPVKTQYSSSLLWVTNAIKYSPFESKIEAKEFRRAKKRESKKEKKKKIFKRIKTKRLPLRKKIDLVLDRVCRKKKKKSFFWAKSKIFSKLIMCQEFDTKKRWR